MFRPGWGSTFHDGSREREALVGGFRTWRGLCAALSAVVLSVLFAPGAAVASTGTKTWTAHGLTYVAQTGFVAHQSQAGTTASCPAGRFVVGGGLRIKGAFANNATVNSIEGASSPGWIGYAQNEGSADLTTIAYAICTVPVPDYVSATTANLPAVGGLSSAVSHCPSGETILDGAVNITGDYTAHVDLTGNISKSQDDPFPDDAWVGEGHNRGAQPQTLSVSAICDDQAKVYPHRAFDVPPMSQKTVKVPCPRHTTVTGGGALDAALTTEAQLGGAIASSVPYALKRGAVPDKGWAVTVRNGGSDTLDVVALAVCERFFA